jgi:hypothetical protein
MTTAYMGFTEGSFLIDPSQEAYPPPFEPTGSGNLPLKNITLSKPGHYVLIAKAVITNYTNTIVNPEFNIFTNDPYKIVDFTQLSLLPYYPSTGDLSSTVAYEPFTASVSVVGWLDVKEKSEKIFFGFNPFNPQQTRPKVMVFNYSLLALLIDDFSLQEDHNRLVNAQP